MVQKQVRVRELSSKVRKERPHESKGKWGPHPPARPRPCGSLGPRRAPHSSTAARELLGVRGAVSLPQPRPWSHREASLLGGTC